MMGHTLVRVKIGQIWRHKRTGHVFEIVKLYENLDPRCHIRLLGTDEPDVYWDTSIFVNCELLSGPDYREGYDGN